MKILRSLYFLRPRLVVIASLAGLGSGVATVAVVSRINAALAGPEGRSARAVGVFGVIALAVLASGITSQGIIVRLAQTSVQQVRERLVGAILRLSLQDVEKTGESALLATLTQDTGAVSAAIIALPLLLTNLAIVVGCLTFMFIMSWQLALVAIGLMAIAIATYRVPIKLANQSLAKARVLEEALFASFQGLTRGFKELQLGHRRRVLFEQDVNEAGDLYRIEATRGMTLYTAAGPWGQMFFLVLIGTVLFVAPRLGSNPSTLAGFTVALLYLNSPLAAVLNTAPVIGRAEVAFGRISALGLDTLPPPKSTTEIPGVRSVSCVGVEFSYAANGSEFHLGPIDLTLTGPSVVFLTGGNGSGKTTLAKILAGLYVPDSGTLVVDGDPEVDLDAYRDHVSMVFADAFLFPKLYDGTSSDARSNQLQRLRLENHVAIDEDGRFSTTQLSQGQRKRLALVVALLEDRDVIVLDEWAAEQDWVSRRWFYEVLLNELRSAGKLVIVISHDERYFSVADRVVTLEVGKLSRDLVNDDAPEPRGASGGAGQ